MILKLEQHSTSGIVMKYVQRSSVQSIYIKIIQYLNWMEFIKETNIYTYYMIVITIRPPSLSFNIELFYYQFEIEWFINFCILIHSPQCIMKLFIKLFHSYTLTRVYLLTKGKWLVTVTKLAYYAWMEFSIINKSVVQIILME